MISEGVCSFPCGSQHIPLHHHRTTSHYIIDVTHPTHPLHHITSHHITSHHITSHWHNPLHHKNDKKNWKQKIPNKKQKITTNEPRKTFIWSFCHEWTSNELWHRFIHPHCSSSLLWRAWTPPGHWRHPSSCATKNHQNIDSILETKQSSDVVHFCIDSFFGLYNISLWNFCWKHTKLLIATIPCFFW